MRSALSRRSRRRHTASRNAHKLPLFELSFLVRSSQACLSKEPGSEPEMALRPVTGNLRSRG